MTLPGSGSVFLFGPRGGRAIPSQPKGMATLLND